MRLRARYAAMDGIKGLALLAIVLYHADSGMLPGGFVGVETLFVVSGFLMARGLIAESDGTGHVGVRRFYVRRLARLWPAMAFMVLACVSLGLLIDRDTLVGIRAQGLSALTFCFNWAQIASGTSYFAASVPQLLRPLWYVAVLVQFALVLPWLVAGLRRLPDRRLRPVAVGVLAVLSAVLMGMLYQPGQDPTRVYYGLDTHVFGLLAGVTLAYLLAMAPDLDDYPALGHVVRAAAPWAATVALGALGVLAVTMRQGASAFRGGLALATIATVLLIAGSVTRGSWMEDLFRWRPLALLGRYSYGIYLWHWPLLVLLDCLLPGLRGRWIWVVWLLCAVLTVAMTAVSHRFVECPALAAAPASAAGRRTSREGTPRPLEWRGKTVVAIVAAVLVAGFAAGLVCQPEKTKLQIELERQQAMLAEQAEKHKKAADAAAKARQAEAAAEQARQQEEGRKQQDVAVDGTQIHAFGDSVMLGAASALTAAFPGVTVDAAVSRFIRDAPGLVTDARQRGNLGKFVVISMNTNSVATEAQFQAIADAAGEGHVLVIVTAHGDRSWIPVANQAARAWVAAHPGMATLADWDQAIAAHPEWLNTDGIHPTQPGCDLYATTVRDAIEAWARSH
ncbi:acyltransferase [Bifidobacterium pullorum subsp. saeculare]|uniref:Acyltransferase n=1 Tax=Bifidobacterium pullorum subsp. saeculare TaxID=78257 RepID=A0A939B7Y2_9BIFI|nr:acyltransferase family protein [Bifidobacterium pullorum]MBM6699257.1 acyltransferase [Bifidobacterium pullorum subsp. saeculare]